MKKLVILAGPSLTEVFQPVFNEFEPLYWLVDFQSGPFDSLWITEHPDNERRFEAICVDFPLLENSSTQLWNPGTLPELSSLVQVDEWSYLIGIHADEASIRPIAAALFPIIDRRDHFSLELIHQLAEIFMVYADQYWEVYSKHGEWLERLQRQWAGEFVEI